MGPVFYAHWLEFLLQSGFNPKISSTMSLTFSQVTSLWKADKRRWVKPSTYAVYIQITNKHILPFFGSISPEALSEEVIQRFADGLLAQGLSIHSIRDVLMILKMILRFGEKLSAWPNIIYDIHFPTTAMHNTNIPVLTTADQRKLLNYLHDNFSFRNLGLLICLYSGLRIGEVCGLQWKDLDVATGEIHITKTVQRIWLSDGNEKDYRLSVGQPKTASSVRSIPICKDLMKIVRPLRKVMADDFYVISNAATPLEPRYYRDYFRKLLASLGIPPTRFHALRHSFATRCIESKCDYKTVSVILGHSSLATTMDLYVHPGFEEKKRCVNRMAKSLQV